MNRAAFFDVDGTLIENPSLERRFFRMLRHEGKIPWRNYFAWLAEAVRLAPNGLMHVQQGNKAYLRGVRSSGHRAARVVNGSPFLPEAIECVVQHAANGERIVFVTGTLQFLAEEIAGCLRQELAKRNTSAEIFVCATRLEEKDGRWTGRILGQPMFGESKAIAIWWLAEKWKLNLAECSAYGDSTADQWMLASVGKPTAVNPDAGLKAAAKRQGWRTVRWRAATKEKVKLAKMVPERAR
ncbi:MAG TPA: HAD-IB family hydrolase [Candidatus Dormibacteraeota bacterium]|jgi:HAD superfamily hydrolase (TIGR01490 family)|nr:HAD-IB family hydrolase [Candidatus Dormibacteraeota bacterium]